MNPEPAGRVAPVTNLGTEAGAPIVTNAAGHGGPVTLGAGETKITLEVPRFEEWHVTILGDPIAWHAFCLEHGLKPLYIELQNGELQLMCASAHDPRYFLSGVVDEDERPIFPVVRVKHEVSALRDGETAVYYEAHVKFNGPWRTDRKGVSRDLFRVQRWYMTKRSRAPFDADAHAKLSTSQARPSRFAEVEYEVCILDTNPKLDEGWL